MSSTHYCQCVRQNTRLSLVDAPHVKATKQYFRHIKFHTNIASQLRTKRRDVRMSKLRIKEYINCAIMESKHDIMYPKSDNSRKDIVEFVKEVEKYPCLYNKTLPEYANKMFNRRAWSAIAKRANTSVPECRDRWRKIRISFMRSLKQQASSKPPMRPYYLTEELHFLHPFLSIRPKTYEKVKLPNDSNMDVELAPLENHDTSDDSASLASFESDPVENTPDRAAELNRTAEINRAEIINKAAEINRIVEMNRITYNDNTIPNIMNGGGGSIENGHGRQHGGRNSYSDDIEGNPRKMFLLSMLPDIEQLTEPEMRIFRREVISTIDKIIGDRSIGVNRIKILGN